MEHRTVATSQWIRDHVRPERRHFPLGIRLPKESAAESPQFYRSALLSAALQPSSDRLLFLHDRMTGQQRFVRGQSRNPRLAWVLFKNQKTI